MTSLRRGVRWAGLASVVALMGTMPDSLLAQVRTTDPIAAARTMFETRQPATATAETLRREHRATIGTATSALRTAGYEAREVVSAITSSFGASQSAVYAAMKEAGFPPSTISGGFSSAGVQLGCIDPQGYAIPCGNFGGQSDAPVMGQLTWSPQAEGPTDGQLTITGTNIPLLTVRIGMNVLTQLSASSSAVVVRLPSSTMTGDLTVRRSIDPAVGTLVAGFRVVQPPVPWASYGAAALAGALEDAKYWIGGAKINALLCSVNGPIAAGVPGVLSSQTGFQGKVRDRLLGVGAPAAVANAWDSAFRTAWTQWATQATIPALPWYPALSAFPASSAPPMPNVPFPVGALVSPGALAMQAPVLRQSVLSELGNYSGDASARGSAVQAFSTTLSSRFDVMLATAQVMLVYGSGKVPLYNPPNVPVGPVQGGSCSGTGVIKLSGDVF